MARLDNWQTNLSSLIEEKRQEPFKFPSWNCMFWTNAGVEAVLGVDLLAAYKGKFKNELGAAKLLRKLDGVETSQAFFEKHFGDILPIARARPGDIVFADPASIDLELPADAALFGPVPGICYGAKSFFAGEAGLVEADTLKLGQALWVL